MAAFELHLALENGPFVENMFEVEMGGLQHCSGSKIENQRKLNLISSQENFEIFVIGEEAIADSVEKMLAGNNAIAIVKRFSTVKDAIANVPESLPTIVFAHLSMFVDEESDLFIQLRNILEAVPLVTVSENLYQGFDFLRAGSDEHVEENQVPQLNFYRLLGVTKQKTLYRAKKDSVIRSLRARL